AQAEPKHQFEHDAIARLYFRRLPACVSPDDIPLDECSFADGFQTDVSLQWLQKYLFHCVAQRLVPVAVAEHQCLDLPFAFDKLWPHVFSDVLTLAETGHHQSTITVRWCPDPDDPRIECHDSAASHQTDQTH